MIDGGASEGSGGERQRRWADDRILDSIAKAGGEGSVLRPGTSG